MNSLTQLSKNQIRNHAFIWLVIFIYLNFNSSIPGTWTAKIIGSFIEDLNYMVVFYGISLFIFPKYWKYKPIYLAIFTLILFFLYSLITYIDYFLIIPFLGGEVFYVKYPLNVLLTDNIFYYSIIASAGAASFFYRYTIVSYLQQAEREKNILTKELNFLKNQFNSHITFNFLTYCYSKVHLELPKTAESIELFSDMLRYNLQTKSQEKVPLSGEISYIKDFLSLQKLIIPEAQLKFEYNEDYEDVYIVPRICISVIERIFNDSFYHSPHLPIAISLYVVGGRLSLSINGSNSKIFNLIKFEDIKPILNFYYIKNYTIDAQLRENEFYVHLIIQNL